jgi:hypothetical protein
MMCGQCVDGLVFDFKGEIANYKWDATTDDTLIMLGVTARNRWENGTIRKARVC